MKRNARFPVLLALLTAAACSASVGGPADSAAPPGAEQLDVPRFAVDDPRVGTAGFVRETTRITRTVGETKYTLMVFAVGDVLTLGAMVEGAFSGRALWTLADRRFAVPLQRADRGRSDVPVEGLAARGDHGGFDEYDWVNVDVPLADWLGEGTAVRLEFEGPDGTVVLPESGGSFAAAVVTRS